MLQDGIPIIYNGQEQHYSGAGVPNNREDLWRSAYSTSSTLYTYIKRINAIRAWALQKDTGYLTYKAYPVYSDQHTIAVRKGANSQVISVFTNSGASGKSYSITLTSSATGFTAKQSVTELLTENILPNFCAFGVYALLWIVEYALDVGDEDVVHVCEVVYSIYCGEGSRNFIRQIVDEGICNDFGFFELLSKSCSSDFQRTDQHDLRGDDQDFWKRFAAWELEYLERCGIISRQVYCFEPALVWND
jgi:hypothetical protein